MWYKLKSLFFIVLFAALISCSETKTGSNKVVVTTNIIANSIKEITGNSLEIITLMNSETDPHTYSASPKDYMILDEASIVISNGLHLEGKLQEVIEESHKNRKSHWIKMSDALADSLIIKEKGNVPDPHIWFDVLLWKTSVNYVINQLIVYFPSQKEEWLKNLEKFNQKADSLDINAKKMILSIPENQRYLVTAHDAFSYFSRAYGINIKPLQGRNTMAEPSINDVIELSNFISTQKLPTIFVETTVNKKFIMQIEQNCISKGHKVKIGGSLFSDACGAENTAESTYFGMVNYNLNTIVNGLK